MKTRGDRARWAASPEGIAEAERLAAEERAEDAREAAAAAAAALRRDAVRTEFSGTRSGVRSFGGLSKAARCTRAADLLAQVKAAGSWRNYVSGARAQLVALRKLAETGRAHPGDDTPPELTRLFPAHDDAACTKKKPSKKKAPSRGVGLPDPLFRRVVMFWLG